MKTRFVILNLLPVLIFSIVASACNESSVLTQNVPEERIGEPSTPEILGTWRETDGSTFILINESKIAFYAPNASLEHFWDYVYDGQTLEVYSTGTLMTIQEVGFDGYQMVLTMVTGEGYDGVYNRTGGF